MSIDRVSALLERHKEGYVRYLLGHRIDAKNGVVLHGRLALDVGKALHRAVDDLAAAVNQELGSREAAGIDISVLEVRFETIEGGLRHTGGFGRSGGRG